MGTEVKAVKLLIDINLDGKAYRAGYIEKNPGIHLSSWAAEKTTGTYWGKATQICAFATPKEVEAQDKAEAERLKKLEAKAAGEGDDTTEEKTIEEMSFPELQELAKSKGLKSVGIKTEELRKILLAAKVAETNQE